PACRYGVLGRKPAGPPLSIELRIFTAANASLPAVASCWSGELAYMLSKMAAVFSPALNLARLFTAIAGWSPRSVRGSAAPIEMARRGEVPEADAGSARFNQPSRFIPGVPDSI